MHYVQCKIPQLPNVFLLVIPKNFNYEKISKNETDIFKVLVPFLNMILSKINKKCSVVSI